MRSLFRSLVALSVLAVSVAAHADTFAGTATFSDTSSTKNNFYDFTGSFASSPFSFSGGVGTTYADQLTVSTNFVSPVFGFSPSDNLSVTIDFTEPDAEDSSFSGKGGDVAVLTWAGLFNDSGIHWAENTQTVTFADGSSVLLTLPDLNYSSLDCGGAISGSEDLTISVLTAPAPSPAPEPSSLALFGTGILGAAGMIRRRLSR